MARNIGLLLLIAVIAHVGQAKSRFSALTTAVYTAVEKQHLPALESARAAWHAAQHGVSYELRVRPSARYRTATDPLLRLRVGAGVTIQPQPTTIARAELALRKAEHAAKQAYIRAVETELLQQLEVHLATGQLAVAEHQLATAAENLRQLETSDEYDPTLVTRAEITLRTATREVAATNAAVIAAEAALRTPYAELFATNEVFTWRFALQTPPIAEHPQFAVLAAEAEVAAALAHEQRFRPVHSVQVVGTWEAGEFSASSALRYQRGTPAVSLSGEYDTAGTAERFTLEISGDFLVTDQTTHAITTAAEQHEHAVARALAFLTEQPLVIAQAENAVAHAVEALADALLLTDLAATALAEAPEREAVRRQNEFDRAVTALHRSWRLYVRAVRNYLEESGGVWEFGGA